MWHLVGILWPSLSKLPINHCFLLSVELSQMHYWPYGMAYALRKLTRWFQSSLRMGIFFMVDLPLSEGGRRGAQCLSWVMVHPCSRWRLQGSWHPGFWLGPQSSAPVFWFIQLQMLGLFSCNALYNNFRKAMPQRLFLALILHIICLHLFLL